MFEQDPQASPKRKVSPVALLAGGGAVVATVIAALASVLASDGDLVVVPPEPRADVHTTVATSVRVAADGSTSTVVVTVSARAPKSPTATSEPAKRTDAAGPRPDEPKAQLATTAVPVTTTQPQSNPPTSYSPTSASSSSSATSPTPAPTSQP